MNHWSKNSGLHCEKKIGWVRPKKSRDQSGHERMSINDFDVCPRDARQVFYFLQFICPTVHWNLWLANISIDVLLKGTLFPGYAISSFVLTFAHMAIIEIMISCAQSTNRNDDEQPCHHIKSAATAAAGEGSRRISASNPGKQILFYFYFTLLFYFILFAGLTLCFFTIRLDVHEVQTAIMAKGHVTTSKWWQRQQQQQE